MKKLILISLILICAIALFACADQAPEQTESPCSHNWMRYGCGATQCLRCNEIMPTAADHIWQGESCEGPATCVFCGATTDSADCHLWIPADCQTPKHCTRCSATVGESTSHSYSAHCTILNGALAKECTVCSTVTLLDTECEHSFACLINQEIYACSSCDATILSRDLICLTIRDAEEAGYYQMEISSRLPNTRLNSFIFSAIYNERDSVAATEILSETFTFLDHNQENIDQFRELKIGKNISTIESIAIIPVHTVIIGEDVTQIKTDAFSECFEVRDVYFEGDLPSLEADALWIMATASRTDENGFMYDYAPIAWYYGDAAGFDSYDKIIQGFALKQIDKETPALPAMTMKEYAERSAQESLRIVEGLFANWKDDPYSYLTLIPDCALSEYKRIKDFTLELTKDASDDYERARLIFDWIVNNVEYDMNARTFAVHRVFDEKRAVCSGYTRLMNDMLAAVGIPAFYGQSIDYFGTDCTVADMVSGEYDYKYETHAWVIAYIDGKAIICDPTWGDFDISPEGMANTCRATGKVEGITVAPEEIDPSLYSFALLYSNGGIYHFEHGNLTMGSGVGLIFGLSEDSYEITYRFRTKNDGYTSFEGTLPPLKAAYRSTIITYGDMGFGVTQCIDAGCVEYSYQEALAFVAFEAVNYGNELNLPYRDSFVFGENGVIYYKLDDNRLSVFTSLSTETSITIPETVNGMTVTEIFPNALACTYYVEILLPDTIEKIGHQAFLGCTRLRELKLPKNLKHIEPGAFGWCESLTRVTLHASLETIGFLDAKTFCSPYFLFDAMEPSQLTVTFLGTQEELDAINFYSPWEAENDFVDTEQKEHFLSYVVIAP